jgi:SAM-dependent methyltransferase
MISEFDRYAGSYSTLVQDPLRDRFAGDAGYFHRIKWKVIREFLRESGREVSAMSWLDAGCGQGDLLALAGGHFASSAGCDPSQQMIGTAMEGEIREQPSAVSLPFADESFDLVTAVCVYHHVHGEDRVQLTASIRRVLKPGGLFCIVEHNPWNPVTRLIVSRCPVDATAELLSAGTTAAILRSQSLQVLRTSYFLYCPSHVYAHFGFVERWLRSVPLGGQYAMFARKQS